MISYSQLNPVPISGFGYDIQAGMPSPVVNVRDVGAKGDGRTDDTDAFQAAVDAVPITGGTVIVPRGDYRIDVDKSIVLRSNMLLLMDPAATLAAIPTSTSLNRLIKVWNVANVRIVGGRLVGERRLHVTDPLPDDPGQNEQGFGISIQSSRNIVVSDVHISDFWGDGMWIGAIGSERDERWDPEHSDYLHIQSTNVLINHVVSTHNRRQGLSMGPAENVTITNSTFSFSGPGSFPQEATHPMSGIDLEPQGQGYVRNVVISHCIMMRNRGTGLEIHGNVIGVSVHDCVISDNFGYGFVTHEEANQWWIEKELTGLSFSNNTVTRNGLEGAIILGRTNCALVAGNTFVGNGFRYPFSGGDDPYEEWATSHGDVLQGLGILNRGAMDNSILDNVIPNPELSTGADLLVENTASNMRLRNNTYTNKSDPVDQEFGDDVGYPLP